MYKLVDLHSGLEVGTYQTRKAANKRGDRMNLEYGAHRYSVSMTEAGFQRLRFELGLST